jgi:OOP family OmpA-OmpF porin
MAPRYTLLIIVGIVVYVSLSLYHFRQVKKIPGAEKQNSVHSVLAGDSRAKNWVQVSTSPGRAGENPKNAVPRAPDIEAAPGSERPAPDPLPETSPAAEDQPVNQASREIQTFSEENNELRNSLQHEQSLNQQHVQEITDLRARLLARQSAEDAPAAGSEESSAEKNQIQNLKTFLAAKTEALTRANARITGLAERLDHSRRSLAEAENSNISLQSALSQADNDGANAAQEAGRFKEELVRTREDRKKYLAETGRLHSRLQQANIRLAELESELGKARRTSEAMLRYGKAQTELVAPFRRQIEIINARIEDRNSALLTAEEEISQLRDRERLLQDQVQILQLEVQQHKGSAEKLHETSQALDSAQQHSAKLTEQLKVLADHLNAGEAKISRLNRSLAEAQTAAQDAILQADILKTETQRQQHLETELEEIRKVNEQLNEKITEQGRLLEAARAETVQLTSSLKETGDRLAETADALQRSQTEFRQLITQQAAVLPNSIEADQTIRQLQNALDGAQSSLTATDAELQSLKKSPAPADPTGETATALQQEIDQLRQALADKDLQQQTVERIVTELKNENRLLQEKIIAAEHKSRNTAELESMLEQKSRELNEEKARIIMLEKEEAGLRSALERRERAFSKMQEEQASLRERLESLQRERDTFFPYTLDSDNDTVSDAKDRSPGTVRGAEVGPDGCEGDRDGDGVVDRLDLCPESPDNADANRFGCAGGEPVVLSGIFFSGGNAELSPAAQSYLDTVAGVLELSADSRFEVAGHTDSIGDAGRNLTVSRQRAEAVTDYLIKKGIAPGRLVPAGYGADQPVADNAAAEGRAANRRVELKILPPDENSTPAGEEEPVTAAEEEGLPVR